MYSGERDADEEPFEEAVETGLFEPRDNWSNRGRNPRDTPLLLLSSTRGDPGAVLKEAASVSVCAVDAESVNSGVRWTSELSEP